MLGACGASSNQLASEVDQPGPAASGAGMQASGGAAVADSPSSGGGGSLALAFGAGGSVDDADGGALGLGGAPDPDYHGSVDLCLYPAQIPDNWGAAGAAEVGSATCVEGVLGRFAFNHCRYELLEPTPFDVDPFIGGHSHCCYASKLIGCP